MAARTIQLRQYRMDPDRLDDYIAWFRGRLVPLRRRFGFDLELAYAIPEVGGFVWAPSHPGGREAFETAAAAYFSSAERARVFDELPCPVETLSVEFVAPVL